MTFSRIHAVVLRQFYLLRGSPVRVLSLYIWVVIDIVLWGFITKYLNMIASPGFSFIPAMLGAVLLSDYFARVILGVTTAFFEDVWSRNFLNIFATPLSIFEYLGGLVISSIVTSTAGLIVMILLACGIFGLSFLVYGWALLPFLMILFVFGIALGIFGVAVVLRLGPASEWFIWPIPALISPFAGVFYPISTLPVWMQHVSRLLPPSYVFENMRAIIAGHSPSSSGLLEGGLLSAIYVLCASWCFKRVYTHAVRTGLIARYSAETIS